MDEPESNLPPQAPETAAAANEAAPAPVTAEAVPTLPPERYAQYPEDLRAPWGWVDLAIFLFFGVGSAIVVSQAAAILILVLMGVTPMAYAKNPTALTAHATLSQALWSLVMMLFLFVMVRLRFQARFWRAMGWRDLRIEGVNRIAGYALCLVSGSVFAILISLASGLVATDKKLPIQDLFQTRESVLLVALTAVLVAPLVEETIFRGYLYPVLARTFGISFGVIVTGMLFGLVHSMQLSGGYGQIGLLMIVGIVLTYVRARTGTVLAPFLLHLGYNSLLFVAFYFATGGLHNLPGAR